MGAVCGDESKEDEDGEAYEEAQDGDCSRAVAVDGIAYHS